LLLGDFKFNTGKEVRKKTEVNDLPKEFENKIVYQISA
jgi:hypothetical protein